MLTIIYKSLAEGVSKLIKNGLAFTVMAGAIAGLIWILVWMVQTHEDDRKEWKAEIVTVKAEYAQMVNDLRLEIRECQNNNQLLLIQIAEMKVQLAKR
jgi:hypothetical protein